MSPDVIKKSIAVVTALAVLVGFFNVAPAEASALSELLKRQADLQRQAESSRQKIQQKQREATNLQAAIVDLDGDIADTENQITTAQNQIATTMAVIDELSAEIEQSQQALDELNEKLRQAYISLYELSQTSPIETLLQSDSLNDLISQSQYIQAIQTELQENIGVATALKADLDAKKLSSVEQKNSLVNLKNGLDGSRNALSRRRGQKDYLLTQTQGEQAKYEELLRKLESEHAKLSQEIYAERRRLGGGESVFYGTGGYPWANEPNFYAADPWLFYKRQCVSYTAWKFLSVYGLVFYNTRPGQGSAWNWPALARDQGYQTSVIARSGAIVSWPASTALRMPVGHTAWVEAVNADGTINLSEYNWVIERGYSERRNVDPNRYGTPTYIFP